MFETKGREDEFKDQYRPLILSKRFSKDRKQLESLINDKRVIVQDQLESQLSEWIRQTNPNEQMTSAVLEKKAEEFFKEKGLKSDDYGNWVFYPWRNTLVSVLEEEEFVAVRTVRNKYKITKEEQESLSQKKIGIIGLSVGQSVALSLAMERCFGELVIADFDSLDLGNMNRIRTGIFNLALKKTYIVAREIAEIDPYLKLTLYNEGINDENIDDFFTLNGNLDLLVEECDSLPIKIGSRIKAKSLGIPVLMDTSDRGMIDIERFDQDPERPIFHGLLGEFGSEGELVPSLANRGKEMMMSLLQYENLSERVKFSFSELGKSITSWPQLASSVIMGGAICCHYARMILLGQKVPSGRYYIDLEQIIGSYEGKS
ncbi:ThiF family adenylyltransferase [Pleomorphovibrio marinus]|uniref:ThiF family adenylyltransferase n=1 Tax=Pleomorphovibrio marinus TaxID=2164132 RepID=UPI000E0C75CC|nr:ThiF family adenylyltransferase [Pleomorphovibrio marinus]